MERFFAIHNAPLYLGRCGENEVREIAFDLSVWQSQFGDGTVQLMAKRSGEDAMYPVPLTVDGRWAVWTVTDADTAISGRAGECELSYMPTETALAKSEIWATFVLPSMDGDVTDPPSGAEAYIDHLRAELAQQIVLAEAVEQNAETAVQAADSAKTDADRAEAARDSIVVDEAKLSQAVSGAAASAGAAKTSEDNAAVSETIAVDAANRAQAEADRATIPAVAGVYNVILTDSVTGGRYALIVENGRLAILGVSETLDATDMTLIDSATGTAYELIVESGRLHLKEV